MKQEKSLNVVQCQTEIAILMATYNGEQYIAEQIDSIINQTFKNWTLYIKDDGSTDKTIEIILNYTKLYSNIIFINSNDKHLGACKNFLSLLKMINASYYMFSDQDDIWLPCKIELSYNQIKYLENSNPSIPLVIHTDLSITDSESKIKYESLWKFMKIKPDLLQNRRFFPVCNPCTGCTMIINNLIKDVIYPIPDDVPMHDLWIAFKVSIYGKIRNLPFPTILYRQHDNNSIGAKVINHKYFLSRILSINKTFREQYLIASFFVRNGYDSRLKYFLYKYLYSLIRFF